jgi:hypothetical protein
MSSNVQKRIDLESVTVFPMPSPGVFALIENAKKLSRAEERRVSRAKTILSRPPMEWRLLALCLKSSA